MSIKKAVITGACGPIGLALLRLLLDKGIKVLVFQREQSVRKYLLPVHPNLKIAYYDLEHILEYESDESDYDAFFHLGWANTWHEYRNRLDKQMENVQYTCNAVELAHKLDCKVFVGVGSQAEYGRKNEPLRHDMLCEPETPYGIMKLCACYSSEYLCQKYDIRHVWARVLSAYGYCDNAYSVLISSIRAYVENRPMQFSKGEQVWDFLHMDDVADALYCLALSGKNGKKYPIGSGEKRTLKEYLTIMGESIGCLSQMEIGALPYRDNAQMYLSADVTELKKDTGWEQKILFCDGIQRVYEFYKRWDCIGDGVYRERIDGQSIEEFGAVWNSISKIRGMYESM